ncbi:ANR28 phosphatase, partial [Atractosteus spatula]|nr:ANR28 phosphatase [Atractosteus spatula]
MSRVCIVVLEEEEDDPSTFVSKVSQEHYPLPASDSNAQDRKPPLLKAIFNVDPDEVRSLIFKKEDVNVQDNEKRTPLHAAAYLGDAEIIELLILSGARVNAKDNKWLTPLHRAVASCSEVSVQVLLKHSADVNARDKNWQTPLHIAAANKAVKCAEALVPLLSNVNVSDRAGRTALHHAAFSGHVEMVKLLLSRGANINAFDKKDRRAIHWAAYMGHIEVVKLLVSHGAEVTCKDKKAYTPLHASASSGMISVVKYLLDLGVDINEPNAYGNTPLHVACYNGQDVVVNELIDCGANVNQVNEKGFAPLHFTAASRHGALCLELLVGNGADVNIKSKDGKTPLHMTAIHGRFSRSQAVIQSGAEIDCEDKNGNTPLHIAARYGHELLINTLITNGADTAKRGIHGMFPLHLAALSGFSDCCRKLLSSGNPAKHYPYNIDFEYFDSNPDFSVSSCICFAGFDIDTPDNFGRTCLHAAAAGGNLECLNLLLNTGADFNKKDKFGRTPLHYAAANCNYQCLFALVGSGASVNDLDERGCTPLHYAAASDTDGNTLSIRITLSAFLSQTREILAILACGECLEYLLRNDANPGIRDKHGYNAVHYAAAYGHRLCLELIASETPLDVLMETSGADILNDSDARAPISPLHLAAYHSHHQALEVLVQSLLDLDVRNSNGRTPLDLAAFKGHVECVDVLINQGASILVKDYTLKRTPIHAAATNGHSECLRLLIGNADLQTAVDIQDGNGQIKIVSFVFSQKQLLIFLALARTPLMLSVLSGHTDCVYSLLNKGANVNAKDKWGRTALHRGAVTGHEECVEALLQHNANFLIRDCKGRTAVHLAAACGHIGVLGGLLQAVQSMDTVPVITDNRGYTPLHWACYNGHDTCVELLLEQEIFQKMEGNPFSPLHCAVINDNEGAAEMLIDTLGAAIVNATDSKARTPLHAAAFTDHVECLQLLLSHNAQVNTVDSSGKTPLMMAAENGQTNAVEVLVSSAKADLTLQDSNKNTALHLACSKVRDLATSMYRNEIALRDSYHIQKHLLLFFFFQGHETSALLILEKITDRNLINSTNAALQTPLHVAARNGLTVVVQELLGKGASVLAVDENGYTPALACAPNKDVADCLALILATMMPVSPSTTMPSLSFNAINHYTNPSKTVTFDTLPILRSEHTSYCSFNNIGREDGYSFNEEDELNDSDSETY